MEHDELIALVRQITASIDADMNEYMQANFYPRIDPFLDEVFKLDFNDPDVSPVVLFTTDCTWFLENNDGELCERVLPRLRAAMAKWADHAKRMGITGEFERLVQHHYDRFSLAVLQSAIQRLLDVVDDLRAADDRWRAANPEKAALLPDDDALKALKADFADALDRAIKRAFPMKN